MLLLLSYPLHPPRRPAELRTVQPAESQRRRRSSRTDSRDPFGTREEIEAARRLIPVPPSWSRSRKAGHDLFRTPGRAGTDVAAKIATAFLRFADRG